MTQPAHGLYPLPSSRTPARRAPELQAHGEGATPDQLRRRPLLPTRRLAGGGRSPHRGFGALFSVSLGAVVAFAVAVQLIALPFIIAVRRLTAS